MGSLNCIVFFSNPRVFFFSFSSSVECSGISPVSDAGALQPRQCRRAFFFPSRRLAARQWTSSFCRRLLLDAKGTRSTERNKTRCPGSPVQIPQRSLSLEQRPGTDGRVRKNPSS